MPLIIIVVYKEEWILRYRQILYYSKLFNEKIIITYKKKIS